MSRTFNDLKFLISAAKYILQEIDIERKRVKNLLSLAVGDSIVIYITRKSQLNREKVGLLIELRLLEYKLSLLVG